MYEIQSFNFIVIKIQHDFIKDANILFDNFIFIFLGKPVKMLKTLLSVKKI